MLDPMKVSPSPKSISAIFLQVPRRHSPIRANLNKLKSVAARSRKNSARCPLWPSAIPFRTTDWHAMTLLDQALHGGRAGRMYRHLVLEKQMAVEVDGGIEDIFGYNGPTQMATKILHKPEYSSDATLAEFDAVVREVQQNGITQDEL